MGFRFPFVLYPLLTPYHLHIRYITAQLLAFHTINSRLYAKTPDPPYMDFIIRLVSSMVRSGKP